MGGSQRGTVGCYGRPDSCQGVTAFNLPPGAHIIPGAGFECKGKCPLAAPAPFQIATPKPTNYPTPAPTPLPTISPTDPTNNPTKSPTPAPTNNPTPAPTPSPTPLTRSPTPAPTPKEVLCGNLGYCSCDGNSDCIITCDGEIDSCKDSIIECNN